MIKQSDCIKGTEVIVNDYRSKSHESCGIDTTNLVAMVYTDGSTLAGKPEPTILVGTVLTLVEPPKRYNGNGNQAKFTIKDDDTVYSAWWCIFSKKVNLIHSSLTQK